MDCIKSGPLRKHGVEKGFSQMLRLDGGLQLGHTAQRREAPSRLSFVSLGGFLQNRFGNETGK